MGQGTAGYQLAHAERPVPPGTLLGTTLPEHFPFEYHLYRPYPAGDGACEQALSSSAYSDKGDVAAEPGLIGEFKAELPEQRLSVGSVHYPASDSLAWKATSVNGKSIRKSAEDPQGLVPA
jgi:hypothetical protein